MLEVCCSQVKASNGSSKSVRPKCDKAAGDSSAHVKGPLNLLNHRCHWSVIPLKWKDASCTYWSAGIPWHSKYCYALNIQPEGSSPSNLGEDNLSCDRCGSPRVLEDSPIANGLTSWSEGRGLLVTCSACIFLSTYCKACVI